MNAAIETDKSLRITQNKNIKITTERKRTRPEAKNPNMF